MLIESRPRTESRVAPRDSMRFVADRFGRLPKDLRLSVTDRCNLRCSYCIPEGATDWLAAKDLLTSQEISKLTYLAVQLGVEEVRLTGGEPLLRPDLEEIVWAVKQAFEQAGKPAKIALTTNGVGLAPRLQALTEAGLGRVNVSLDTLDPQRFKELTHRDKLDQVMESLQALRRRAISPIKVNSVILDEQSLAEIPALVRFCLQEGFQWRAIEFMPIGPLAKSGEKRPSAKQIFEVLNQHFDLTSAPTPASAPARRWEVAESATHPTGMVGIIASTSAPFCHACDRTRLSANGRIYSCLFEVAYTDLLTPLRRGATNGQLQELWIGAMAAKPAGHQALANLPENYRMSQIGG